MLRQEKPALCVSLPEVQAYARIESGEEEAILAGLLRVASEMCETFLNQALLARPFEVDVRAGRSWTLLQIQPIRALSSVRQLHGGEQVSPASYRIDIDHEGRGFIGGLAEGETYTVAGIAGLAEDGNGVPEPIRQGILRLTAYLFANRDGQAGEIPKAVSALWRPYRRAGLVR